MRCPGGGGSGGGSGFPFFIEGIGSWLFGLRHGEEGGKATTLHQIAIEVDGVPLFNVPLVQPVQGVVPCGEACGLHSKGQWPNKQLRVLLKEECLLHRVHVVLILWCPLVCKTHPGDQLLGGESRHLEQEG
jgi:hypothetical protein